METAIVSAIQEMKDRIAELEIDLEVAQEQVAFYKPKALLVPKLKDDVKQYRREIIGLLKEHDRIMRAL